jgi:hypothetical protein
MQKIAIAAVRPCSRAVPLKEADARTVGPQAPRPAPPAPLAPSPPPQVLSHATRLDRHLAGASLLASPLCGAREPEGVWAPGPAADSLVVICHGIQ